MDEIYGYFPPTANPPSKKPMLTLLKQGGRSAWAWFWRRRTQQYCLVGRLDDGFGGMAIGLVECLSRLGIAQVPDVEVVSDSELMVKQMRGEYRVKNHAALRSLRRGGPAGAPRRKRGVSTREARAQRGGRPAGGTRRSTPYERDASVRCRDRSRRRRRRARDDRRERRFRSPAVYRTYEGKAMVAALLKAVATVFENFRYTNEWRDGATTILFFEAKMRDVNFRASTSSRKQGRGDQEIHRHDPPAVGPASRRPGDASPVRRRLTPAIMAARGCSSVG